MATRKPPTPPIKPPVTPKPPVEPPVDPGYQGPTLQVLDMIHVQEKAITAAIDFLIAKHFGYENGGATRQPPKGPMAPTVRGNYTLVPNAKPQDTIVVRDISGVPLTVNVRNNYGAGSDVTVNLASNPDFWAIVDGFVKKYVRSPMVEVPECIRHLPAVEPKRSPG